MKFVVGLLLGALGTLALATLAGLDWSPPSLLADDLARLSPEVSQKATSCESTCDKKAVELNVEQDNVVPSKSVTSESLSPGQEAKQETEVATDVTAVSVPVPASFPSTFAESAAESATELASAVPVPTAIVWKPFHSEVSATGFARRLSAQLGYPFRALREGPATYLVVYEYDSEEQRELLRQQVVAVTGFSAL